MDSFQFVDATKAGCRARVALTGPSGAGKTWTALTIAQGLDLHGGHIGVIDTDRQSARLYADVFRFKWMPMTRFGPEDLVRAVIAATDQNIGCLIIDTGTPFWSGPGGMLDRVDQLPKFEGWKTMRPIERVAMNALFGFPGHVIMTLRVKTEYVIEKNDRDKHEPKKMGLKPEQRDNIDTEFDVVGDLSEAGASMRISKTRCPELANKAYSRPTSDVGETIQTWLDRDAIGEPLNPNTVREWALAAGRTPAELGERYRELEQVGQLTAVVMDLNGGDFIEIGPFLIKRDKQIKDAERAAQRAAAAEAAAAAAAAAGQQEVPAQANGAVTV